MKIEILIWCVDCKDFVIGTSLRNGKIICSRHKNIIGKLLIEDECRSMEKI